MSIFGNNNYASIFSIHVNPKKNDNLNIKGDVNNLKENIIINERDYINHHQKLFSMEINSPYLNNNENKSNYSLKTVTKNNLNKNLVYNNNIINEDLSIKIKENNKKEEEKKEEEKKEEEEKKIIEVKNYKYHINTNQSDLIYIPEINYGTDDYDLKNFVDIMNEKPLKKNGYSNVIDEPDTKIYKKMTEGVPVILIKSICKIPYDKQVIFNAISDLNIRKKWDSVFSELKVVNHDGENGAEILYMIIKSPSVFVSDRDFVQQRKMWKNFPDEHSHILHFISVENKDCPIKKKLVRAETVISGYFIKDDEERGPNHSILGIISQTDIKGNIPTWLVNKFAPKSSKGWVKSLYKGCKLICGEK